MLGYVCSYILFSWCDINNYYVEINCYKGHNVPMLTQSRPAGNIQECLTLFTNEETLDEDDAYHCATCNKETKAIKKMELWYVVIFVYY